MKYDYYKPFKRIYRIPSNWKETNSGSEKTEFYYRDKWTNVTLTSNWNFIQYYGNKKLTKEEAFMELL